MLIIAWSTCGLQCGHAAKSHGYVVMTAPKVLALRLSKVRSDVSLRSVASAPTTSLPV